MKFRDEVPDVFFRPISQQRQFRLVRPQNPPVGTDLVQPLHGLTFALLHLASMRLIVQVVPIRLAATAQSIYGTLCVGLATALLASGLLYGRMGGHAFLVMAALCFLALPLCAGLRLSQVPA